MRAGTVDMTMTDPTARRLAWVTFGAICSTFLGSLALGVATSTLGNISGITFALLMFLFPLVGILICRQQPRNRIGWICLGIGILWGLTAILDQIGEWGLAARPGTVPGWQVAEALSGALWAPALGLMGTFLLLLFPDGHLPSRRWRPVAWLSALSILLIYAFLTLAPGRLDLPGPKVANPLGVDTLRPLTGSLQLVIALLPLCFVLCATALVLRFRRARGVPRQQLKWLAAAAVVLAVYYLLTISLSLLAGMLHLGQPAWLSGLQDIVTVAFALVPVAIGFAVLKYNLFEIDLVISKTVVVGTLAVFITAVYVAIVVGLGAALPHVVRKDNLALSLVATAVVAVAFQPVRVRVQRYANRLVYGSRATPYEVLSDFASRMRGTYDSAELLPHMARTVAEGMGASQAEVWLQVGGSLTREAVWPPADEVVPVPTPDGSVPALPADRVAAVRQEGEQLGAITVTKPPTDPLTPAEAKLLDDVAAQAGLLLRTARLIEDLRSSRQRLVSAQDEERRRLERNLHDGAQQSLVAVALTLRMTTGQLETSAPDAVRPLEQASAQLSEAIEELRELARGIHPAILTERGLGPAVSSLAERSPVPVTVTDDLNRRLPATIEATAYFVVAEALTNAAKYAEASQVTVSLTDKTGPDGNGAGSDWLTVVIADDGRGGVDLSHGTGLRGLADRVSVADGHLEVESRPGQGTRITCRLPVPRQSIPEQPTGAEPPTRAEQEDHAAVGVGR